MADKSNSQEMSRYWDDKISWWADSSYEDQPRGFIDKFMAGLRRSVHARAVIALELLKPHLEGKTVLDMGCGSGHFLTECLKAGASHVIGIDVAPQAIDYAQDLAERNGFADRSTFLVGKADTNELPDADIITGFGLIDWLETQECLQFFERLRDKQFVFSFSDQDGSIDQIIHHYYLVERLKWFGKGVRVYHHPAKLISRRLNRVGIHDFEILSDQSMRFGRLVHHL